MEKKLIRTFNQSTIFVIFLMSLVITFGQISSEVLSSVLLRTTITIAFVGLAFIVPSSTIALVSMGYFVPTVTGVSRTLLPATYFYYFFLMLLCTLIIFKRKHNILAKNRPSMRIKILLPYAVLLFIVLISDLIALTITKTSGMTINYFFSFSLGLIGAFLIKNSKDEDIVMSTLIGISVFFSGWTLFGYGKLNVLGSRYEVGFDQNYMSFFIGLGIIVLFGMLYHRASLKVYLKLVFGFLFLLNWAAIFRLGSRGVFIALLAAIIWVFIRNSRNFPKAFLNVFLGFLLFLVVFSLPGMKMMTNRFQEKDTFTTASYRLPLVLNSIRIIASSSIQEQLIGSGTGGGMQALKTVYGRPVSPHNQYLEAAMDYGIIGLAMLLWLIFNGYRKSRQLQGFSSDVRIGIIVFMLFGFFSLTPLRYVLPWIAFGLTLSSPQESEYADNDSKT